MLSALFTVATDAEQLSLHKIFSVYVPCLGLLVRSLFHATVAFLISCPVFSALRVFAICGKWNVLVLLVFLCSMFVPCANIASRLCLIPYAVAQSFPSIIIVRPK